MQDLTANPRSCPECDGAPALHTLSRGYLELYYYECNDCKWSPGDQWNSEEHARIQWNRDAGKIAKHKAEEKAKQESTEKI